MVMCPIDGVQALDPLSWKSNCALGDCPICPELILDISATISLDGIVEMTQWRKGWAERPDKNGKRKEICSLFGVTMGYGSERSN